MLTIVNPLEGGLDHYVHALDDVLKTAGAALAIETQAEPSRSGGGRLTWVRQHLSVVRRTRGAAQLVVWPVAGVLDVAALGTLSNGMRALVIHDPVPLVRNVGYGRAATAIARLLGHGVEVIVHSAAAAADLPSSLGPPTHLPLPILEGTRDRSRPDVLTVRVIGRYKAGRDLEALESLASIADDGVRLEILGRGWPKVPGWSVTADTFVDANTFERNIATSSVVVIPYRRFYQSDVAVRALEAGVPVVGPRASSLTDLLGETSAWLVDDRHGWLAAVEDALRSDGAALACAAEARATAIAAWGEWLEARNLRRG